MTYNLVTEEPFNIPYTALVQRRVIIIFLQALKQNLGGHKLKMWKD
jgi:hypothetical protein